MAVLDPEVVYALGQACHSPAGAALIAEAVANSGGAAGTVSPDGSGNINLAATGTITLGTGLVIESYADALTAHSGGTQAAALQLAAMTNRITTVAAPGDSVALPAAVPGLRVTVINDGANSMQVFGSGTDTINGIATATGIAQAVKAVVTYSCTAAGLWEANLASSSPVGSPTAGSRIASGVASITGTGTVVTGLSTVTAVIVSPVGPMDGVTIAAVSATIGNQTGAPAAGSVNIAVWKATSVSNPTLIAATAAESVSWIAFGQ
jgi:hypothetical protein